MGQLIKAIYLARRNPRLERGRFPERWRRHGALALSLPFMDPCVGYFHNDVFADPPRDADPYTGALWSGDYDGVGVVMFANTIDLGSLLTHPDFPILLADEHGAFNEPVEFFTTLTHERVHRLRLGTATQFFAFLRPRPGVDGETFAQRWLAHTALVMSSPELAGLVLRYVQCTPMSLGGEGEQSSDAPAIQERLDIGLTDVAGVAQVGFASGADMETYLSHPDREAIGRDLAEFADLERSVLVATNEVTMKASALLG
jgi:hypothetical protein